jgi:hydrogenase maturation protein HypF
MCPACAAEYADPANRRFHAQPVACPDCGPQVWLEQFHINESGTTTSLTELGDDAIQRARKLLADGRIVAVKGLGGFHLACDASNPQAVAELRRRKLRVDKPFALMMSDVDTAERCCFVDPAERALLESVTRPIVLLRRRDDSAIAADVAPGQTHLGVMLPYTPLHYLLLERKKGFPAVLVMTSGNLAEEPICTDNVEARVRLAELADAFLVSDRDIHIRTDDSVIRVFEGRPYPIRRSRGYVPAPVSLPWPAPALLAAGGELKNVFCVTNEHYAFLSHHIGDLENFETLKSFEAGITHFEQLFRVEPRLIAYDLHPNYLATRYALERAEREKLPTIAVQHHHAHIAAAMAENGLDGSRPVIGVAFDGTGYGDDGAIWGAEFLVADYAGYRRAAHLRYFPLPGGDVSTRRPARAALALLYSLGLEWNHALPSYKDFTREDRAGLHGQLESMINSPLTSSMGRLFDAAASLAGVRHAVNYEAQAAIEFEALAEPSETGFYPFDYAGGLIDPCRAIQALVADVLARTPTSIVSARFHNGLAQMVRAVCASLRAETTLSEVALSGGVWQNMTLLGKTVPMLEKDGFTVLTHHQVPANDGGLALGQAAIAAWKFNHP